MIQATDLRIGNYILQCDRKIKKVDCDVMVNIHHYKDEANYYPIPLTPEILLKMGFEKYNDDYVVKIGHRYFLCATSAMSVYTDNTDIEDNGRIWHDHIHYVHQLQNLFHALTGKELIFEL